MARTTSTPGAALESKAVSDFVGRTWDESILPALTEYIKIPNKSPHFDRDWKANGHMDKAVELISAWCSCYSL